jgi:hypothetical protein
VPLQQTSERPGSRLKVKEGFKEELGFEPALESLHID